MNLTGPDVFLYQHMMEEALREFEAAPSEDTEWKVIANLKAYRADVEAGRIKLPWKVNQAPLA